MIKKPLPFKRTLIFLTALIFVSLTVFAQKDSEKKQFTKQYPLQKIKEKSDTYAKLHAKHKQEAIKMAKEQGWVIRKELDNGQLIEIQRVTDYGKPLYFITNNIDAANTISTDEVWSGGSANLNLNGEGMTVGEWDGGGVLTTHQEFNNLGSSRVTQMDNPDATHYHATHVAGTMIAGGVEADAKGMSFEGNLNAYDWDADDSEMIEAGANGLLISNHSYGYNTGWVYDGFSWSWVGDESISSEEDYHFGFYGDLCARWDSIAYQLPYYLIAKAAGNDRGDGEGQTGHPPDGGADGYDCIGWRGNAKNVLTVAAVEDLPSGYTGNPGDVTMTSFSSWGPADDGRIKPDISGNGYNLYSPDDGGDDSYRSISGTSMATPNVAGSLLLLQEHWNETQGMFMKAATLKGLAIHTADEAGANDGPDYKFGWGLMNTKSAAEVISNRNGTTLIEEDSLSDGGTYNLNVEANGNEPLIVTVCWTDPAGTPTEPALDPSTPMLVNDLDVTVTEGSSTYQPYKLDPDNPANAATTGDNDVDNVEKVVVDPASETSYEIVINHEGTITEGPQHFSLIVSGITTGRPMIQTDTVYNITQTTAEVDGEVTDEGSSSVTTSGVVYSLSLPPTLDDNYVTGGSGLGTFTCSLTDLQPDTTYYAAAYATNSAGTNYGKVIEFETDDYLPEVEPVTVTNITTTSADVESEVTDDGGYSITERGFVYNTSQEPTLSDSVVISGSGTGIFNETLSGLTIGTTYYIRSYATNSEGTSYGEEQIFTTACGIISSLPYQQDFASDLLPNCWDNVDNYGSGEVWLFDNPGDVEVNTSSAGNGFAILNSDYYGSGGNQDADLITPTFDLSAYDSVFLYFEHYYKEYSEEAATLSYTTDGGTNWNTIQTWSASSTENAAVFDQNLSAEVAGQSDVRFKWNYVGSYGWYWAVDDVELTGMILTPSVTIEAIPGCGAGNGTITISSNLSGTQTYYLCDEYGSTLDSWTGDASSHDFTGLSDGNYTGKVEKDGYMSDLTSFVTLTNSSDNPTAPTSVNITEATICVGNTTRLSYSGGSGDTFEWYSGACGDDPVGTGNDLTLTPDSTTTYYGRWENACGASACLDVTVTVIQNPEAAESVSASSMSICEGGSTELSYSGGSGDTFEWYSGSCGGTSVGTGNNLTVSPSSTTTYYGRWENSCDVSTCQEITIEVDPVATAPSSVSASATEICEGETTRLSYSGGTGGSFEWYSGSCGGTYVGSGNELTVSPVTTTTYYGRWESACGESTCLSVNVLVNPLPDAPSAVEATSEVILEGESSDLTFTGGTGETFAWYSGSCGGTMVGTGNNLTVTPTETTTYYGRWENSCGSSDCKTVTLTVEQPVETPISADATEDTICSGASTRLSYSGGSGETFSWYSQSCGGTFVGTGNNFTVTPTSTTTYYGRWENSINSSACVSQTIEVENDVDAPNSVAATSESICKGTTTRLSYEGGSGRNFKWYSSSCGGTYVGSGNDLTVSPTVDTQYYGRWENSCGTSICESISITIMDSTTINQQPADQEAESGSNVSFTVDATGSNLTYAWHKDGAELSDNAVYSGSGSTQLTIQSVSSTEEGNYKVIVSGNCGEITSETATLSVLSTGISEMGAKDMFIYPNPTSGKIQMLGRDFTGYKVSIHNLLGEQLVTREIDTKHPEFDLGKYPNGIYFIRIDTGNNQFTQKIILE